MATIRCPQCDTLLTSPNGGFLPGQRVACPKCAATFSVPEGPAGAGEAAVAEELVDKNVAGEEAAPEPVQQSVPAETGADSLKRTPKRGGVRFCLLASAALVLTVVVALGAAWFGIEYALGPQFLPDLLVVIRGPDAPPKKVEAPLPDPNEGKPEPQGLADRLVGTWGGDLPTGDDVTYVYGKDGQFTMILGRPGKQPPRAMSGTWKVTRTEGDTLHIHRESAMPQGGDAFAADATITFPAPNEMEHSIKKGTVRCKRQAR